MAQVDGIFQACYNTCKLGRTTQRSLQRPYSDAGLLQNKLTSIALSVILETSWERRQLLRKR
jgi:hypothetical protein